MADNRAPVPAVAAMSTPVLTCADVGFDAIDAVFAPFGLRIERVPDAAPIPGSWFGDPEAGLIGDRLLLRGDTPVHSALHEGCHWICMDAPRRAVLHTDAGGDYDEENGVCYLQLLLAECVPGFGRARACADMDAWGYSFRLGSAQAWFERDADDARAWLRRHGVLDAAGQPSGRVREG